MPAKLIIKNEVRTQIFIPYTPCFYLPTQKSAILNSPDSLHATSITKSSCTPFYPFTEKILIFASFLFSVCASFWNSPHKHEDTLLIYTT